MKETTNSSETPAVLLAKIETPPVRLEGRYSAMAVCWILGIGSLASFNCILTLGDYYYDVFPRYRPGRVLPLVYQPFALATMALFAFKESKIDTRRRNIVGFIIFFSCTLALVLVDLATSGKGEISNYIGICVFVAFCGVADGHVQGGIGGDLSFMPPEFIQFFLAGLAASGALTSGFRLITKAAFQSSRNGLRKGAMLFLVIVILFEFLCIFLYAFVLNKIPIVKYYRTKAASEGSKTVASDLAAAGIQTEANDKPVERLGTKELFFKNIDYALVLFLTNVLTLSIFPGFLYENTRPHRLGSWYPLVLIAMYNVWNLISRHIPLIQSIKLENRKGLVIATSSRFLLIPAFYFTAKHGILVWMILLVSFLGLTNGYLVVCVFTTAPKGYKGPEQNALGNLLMLCLVSGIVAGVSLGWLWLIGKNDF